MRLLNASLAVFNVWIWIITDDIISMPQNRGLAGANLLSMAAIAVDGTSKIVSIPSKRIVA